MITTKSQRAIVIINRMLNRSTSFFEPLETDALEFAMNVLDADPATVRTEVRCIICDGYTTILPNNTINHRCI